jgi:hypothetical protein
MASEQFTAANIVNICSYRSGENVLINQADRWSGGFQEQCENKVDAGPGASS